MATEVLCICVTIINYSLEFFKVYMMIERENFFFKLSDGVFSMY